MQAKNDFFTIEREIGIDAGHRVMTHGSKCKNIHGHRYTVYAICKGPLADAGEQHSMVIDFGFIKDIMMDEIDKLCDHGFISAQQDVEVLEMFRPKNQKAPQFETVQAWLDSMKPLVDSFGSILTTATEGGNKLYIVPFIPTAENLAKHWFERLAPRVKERTGDRAYLYQVKVQETPNSRATYPVVY